MKRALICLLLVLGFAGSAAAAEDHIDAQDRSGALTVTENPDGSWSLSSSGVVKRLSAAEAEAFADLVKPDPPPPPVPDQWVQTFGDEFDGTTLDRSKWGTGWGAVGFSKPTHMLDSQLTVGNGMLRIAAERKLTPSGRPYASGLIQSHDQFSQRYGRFEARMKIPRGRGLWPAFWTMPYPSGWPPEIDIMEMIGQSPTKVYQTNHWKNADGSNGAAQCIHTAAQDMSTDFHVYGIEWSPGLLIWTVDGVETCRRTANVDHGPMFLIVNLAVGNTGSSTDWVSMPDAGTLFPAYLDVDWVRVYAGGR